MNPPTSSLGAKSNPGRPLVRLVSLATLALAALAALPLGAVTITVNSTKDDNVANDKDCTLREAVQASLSTLGNSDCTAGSGNDEIVFDPKKVPVGSVIKIVKSDDPMGIATNLSIQGASQVVNGQEVFIAVSGAKHSRIFEIGSSVKVHLQDLELREGFDTGGGGAMLISSGSATVGIAHCQFLENEAQELGGAIANSGSAVTIESSTFDLNKAGTRGGALAGGGPWTINDSEFSNNVAEQGGGALFCSANALEIQRSNFSQNLATGSKTPSGFTDGGGAIMSGCSGLIHQSLFELNLALGPVGGGALYLNAAGVATLSQTVFRLNSAGPVSEGGASGGAILSDGNLTVRESLLDQNIDRLGLGGGGICFRLGIGYVVNTALIRNVSTASDKIVLGQPPPEPSVGAAISVRGLAHVRLYNSSLVGNFGTDELFVLTDNAKGEAILYNTLIDGKFTDETCGGDLLDIFDGDTPEGGHNLQSKSPATPTCQGIPDQAIAMGPYPTGAFAAVVPGGTLKFEYPKPDPGSAASGGGDPNTCLNVPVSGIDLLLNVRAKTCTIGAVEAP
jgi:CSLREA domain-containing protein